MKKLLLLSVGCIALIVIAYTQVQLVMEKKLRLEAYDEIVIETGKSSISMKKNGNIVIKGTDIIIEGKEKINVKASGEVILRGNKIKDN